MLLGPPYPPAPTPAPERGEDAPLLATEGGDAAAARSSTMELTRSKPCSPRLCVMLGVPVVAVGGAEGAEAAASLGSALAPESGGASRGLMSGRPCPPALPPLLLPSPLPPAAAVLPLLPMLPRRGEVLGSEGSAPRACRRTQGGREALAEGSGGGRGRSGVPRVESREGMTA